MAAGAALILSGAGMRPAAATPIAPAVVSKTQILSAYEKGVRALAAGDLREAQEAFAQALAEDPKRVKVLLALAEIARLQSDPAKAAGYLHRAVELDPRNDDVQIAWATWLNSQGRFDEARTALELATRADTKAAGAWVALGVLYARTPGDRPKAIDAFHEALQRDPTLAGAHFGLGTVLAESGQSGQAETELKEAARLAPTDPRPWDMLGRLHAAKGETEIALTAYNKALAVDAKYISARLAIGDIAVQSGQVDAAAAAFTKASELNPKADAAWIRLGLLEQTRGRADAAEQAYRRAIDVNPKQAIALNNLAAMLMTRADGRDEALALSRRAVDISPNTAFLGTLSRVYRIRGDVTKADATARQAVEAQTAKGAAKGAAKNPAVLTQ
jgi:superkiller protein 3